MVCDQQMTNRANNKLKKCKPISGLAVWVLWSLESHDTTHPSGHSINLIPFTLLTTGHINIALGNFDRFPLHFYIIMNLICLGIMKYTAMLSANRAHSLLQMLYTTSKRYSANCSSYLLAPEQWLGMGSIWMQCKWLVATGDEQFNICCFVLLLLDHGENYCLF